MTGLVVKITHDLPEQTVLFKKKTYSATTDGPAANTRAKAFRKGQQFKDTAERIMASSAETPADENTNESPMAHGAGEEIVATMAGIVDKLQQVAVGVGVAHPSYAVSKFDGVSEDVEMWLQKFERHARLQYLHAENYVDAFAFHVTGVAETWFLTLPASQLGGVESGVPRTLCTIAAWQVETRARPLLHEAATGTKHRQLCGRRAESGSWCRDDRGPTRAASVERPAREGDAVCGDVTT